MGHSWGNPPGDDTERKSAVELVRTLARVAARGGNLLLNVSPDGAGHVPAWQRERLDVIGAWLARNGDAVVGSGPGLAPSRFDGPTTTRASTVYALCPYRPIESVEVRGLPVRRVRSVRCVGTGRPLAWQARVDALNEILSADPPGDLVIAVPEADVDPVCTAIAIELAEA
jgi:alpha-L-fucosidase